jgi:hypothetical protein
VRFEPLRLNAKLWLFKDDRGDQAVPKEPSRASFEGVLNENMIITVYLMESRYILPKPTLLWIRLTLGCESVSQVKCIGKVLVEMAEVVSGLLGDPLGNLEQPMV